MIQKVSDHDDPLAAKVYLLRVSFLIFWKGNLLFFGKLKKFQIGLVNYLNMLAFLDMKPSLAGIFSALWHIVAETPTNITTSIH